MDESTNQSAEETRLWSWHLSSRLALGEKANHSRKLPLLMKILDQYFSCLHTREQQQPRKYFLYLFCKLCNLLRIWENIADYTSSRSFPDKNSSSLNLFGSRGSVIRVPQSAHSGPNTPHSSQLHGWFKAHYWCEGLLWSHRRDSPKCKGLIKSVCLCSSDQRPTKQHQTSTKEAVLLLLPTTYQTDELVFIHSWIF